VRRLGWQERGCFVGSSDSNLVGEGAVKGGFEVYDTSEHFGVEGFGMPTSGCGFVECLVELIERFGLNSDVEFAKSLGAEAELSAFERERLEQTLRLKRAEKRLDCVAECEVFSTVAQVNPNCICIHFHHGLIALEKRTFPTLLSSPRWQFLRT
jgi:hypothetical protein